MFKITRVVPIHSNNKAGFVINPSTNKIQYIDFERNAKYYTDAGFECFHLYFLSDDEIKKGDWYELDGEIFQMKRDIWTDNGGRKIIATTNKSLTIQGNIEGFCGNKLWKSLPQPSESFIELYFEKYNMCNIITEVMVEYWAHTEEDIQYKVNPKDNTITIKKVKDNYTREEVVNLVKKALKQSKEPYSKLDILGEDKWIEENL